MAPVGVEDLADLFSWLLGCRIRRCTFVVSCVLFFSRLRYWFRFSFLPPKDDQISIRKNINLRKDDLSSEISTLALKHDIAEELERISFHMDSLKKLLKLKSAHGKKMDFILQELFREVNTLSVKIEKPDLKDLALTMKLKVEELREQAQNLE